ncbi:MAG: patatin, partial [Xanthomonadales bacterium]|nr:patatin [Xanthomonadales bacterium]
HFGLALAGYRYTLSDNQFLPLYVGTSVEYGNATELRGDVFSNGVLHGSVYLGADSPLGPVYLGMGIGEDDRRKLFLRIGNIFGRTSIGR